MAHVISIADWKVNKGADLHAAPALECPQCDHETAATNVQADGTTTYRCAGHGHRALTWRIDADGNMLHGALGKRYY